MGLEEGFRKTCATGLSKVQRDLHGNHRGEQYLVPLVSSLWVPGREMLEGLEEQSNGDRLEG